MRAKLLSKKLLPLIILSALILLSFIIVSNPPEVHRKAPSTSPRISVEALAITQAPYQIQLQSYGTVQPRTRSMLVSQVSGQVVWVNPQFRDGGFFKAGEALLQIDQRDYQADVRVAEATLLDAKQQLAEEQALSVQALDDWQRLGNDGTAPDLVLRKPQLLAAKARVISAEASLSKTQLNLERTRILAPFDGRILQKNIDIGQVVANNTELAEIYASDYVEIRLPLRNRDLDFIDLPGERAVDADSTDPTHKVRIHSRLGQQRGWHAQLVRTESAIDESSQQLHVVAQIDNPFDSAGTGGYPLKIGEYVTAEIAGITLDNAIVIPNKTIYQGSYVYLVENDLLMRREVEIAWQNGQSALIRSGLDTGDLLVTTPLGQVTSGTRVNVQTLQPASDTLAAPASDAFKGTAVPTDNDPSATGKSS